MKITKLNINCLFIFGTFSHYVSLRVRGLSSLEYVGWPMGKALYNISLIKGLMECVYGGDKSRI